MSRAISHGREQAPDRETRAAPSRDVAKAAALPEQAHRDALVKESFSKEERLKKALGWLINGAELPKEITDELRRVQEAAIDHHDFNKAGSVLKSANTTIAVKGRETHTVLKLNDIRGVVDGCFTLIDELQKAKPHGLFEPAPHSEGERRMGLWSEPLRDYFNLFSVPDPLRPQLAAKFDALVKAEVAGHAPQEPPKPLTEAEQFGETLKTMAAKEREAALKERYGWRIEQRSWTKAKGKDRNPTPEKFLKWLEATFGDRSEVGLVLNDLKFLDRPAFDKLSNWRGDANKPNSKISKETIESFAVPPQSARYDAERDASAALTLAAECLSSGAPSRDKLKALHRISARALYHAGKD